MRNLTRTIFVVVILWASGFGLSCFAACPSADLTGDCIVNLEDFALLVSQWLDEGVPFPVLNGMTWVSINDDGSGMKDADGNPISHGGFIGEMSKYEITNAQYCEYLNEAKAAGQITVYNNVVYAAGDTSHSQPYLETYAVNSYTQITYCCSAFSVRNRDGYYMGNHPVVGVFWYGATAFCKYYGYRLPTEWEWQAVADYDGSYTYGCGITIDHGKANYDWNNPLNLSIPYTSPVGYYPPYGYGICDMAGNVFEWTDSWYDSSHSYRVLRGGSWDSIGNYCAVSYRSTYDPTNTPNLMGFRVCR